MLLALPVGVASIAIAIAFVVHIVRLSPDG
jgi:hypothetical protein